MTMKPPPPTLPSYGRVTPRVADAATAASTALPPASRISTPASEAYGSSEATAPPVPVAVGSLSYSWGEPCAGAATTPVTRVVTSSAGGSRVAGVRGRVRACDIVVLRWSGRFRGWYGGPAVRHILRKTGPGAQVSVMTPGRAAPRTATVCPTARHPTRRSTSSQAKVPPTQPAASALPPAKTYPVVCAIPESRAVSPGRAVRSPKRLRDSTSEPPEQIGRAHV